MYLECIIQSVQSLSHVQLFVTPWTAAHEASLSIINSWSLLKLMSIASVMPSNHLILCCPLLLLSSIFPSIMVFSNESVLHIRWPKYWGFSFNISPPNEHPGLTSFRMDWLDLLAVQGTLQDCAQTHVHQVGDGIQPSHPLLSPSPLVFNLSQHQSLFQRVSSSHQVAKVLEFQLQHQSFQ